jgi:N-acetyl-anhydromuramyl-L-alanine amidase AmpD
MSLNIVDMPSPNYSSRDGATPRWIIVHGTAGFETARQVGTYFGSTASQVSAHYVVGQGENEIVRCVDESLAAWANGPISGPAGVGGDGVHHDAWWDQCPQWGGLPNPNPVTISIEHVKPHTDNSDQLTAAQQAASFALILDICKRQRIPMRKADAQGGITGHFSMDPVNRSWRPGPYPWDELWAFLKGASTMTPNKWQIADAQKEWQSTAHLFGGTAPSYDSGIAKAWMQRVYQGQRLGPPLSAEYDSTDWGGKPIRVQQFTNARCEWRTDGSSCRFFDARGEIL